MEADRVEEVVKQIGLEGGRLANGLEEGGEDGVAHLFGEPQILAEFNQFAPLFEPETLPLAEGGPLLEVLAEEAKVGFLPDLVEAPGKVTQKDVIRAGEAVLGKTGEPVAGVKKGAIELGPGGTAAEDEPARVPIFHFAGDEDKTIAGRKPRQFPGKGVEEGSLPVGQVAEGMVEQALEIGDAGGEGDALPNFAKDLIGKSEPVGLAGEAGHVEIFEDEVEVGLDQLKVGESVARSGAFEELAHVGTGGFPISSNPAMPSNQETRHTEDETIEEIEINPDLRSVVLPRPGNPA